MRLISILLSLSRTRALLTVLFGLLSGASSAALIALLNRALAETGTATAGALLPLFIGIGVAALLTRITSQMLLNRLQHQILKDLRLRFGRHLITTSLRRLEEMGSHRMLTPVIQDITAVSSGVTMLPEVFINLAIVLGLLCYMAWMSWPLFLALVGFIAFGQLTYSLPATTALKLQSLARENTGVLFKQFMAIVQGAKELRLNRRRRRALFGTEVEPLADKVRSLAVRSDDLYAVANSWGMFIYMFVLGLLIFLLPRFSEFPASTLVSYVLVTLYLQQPLTGIIAAMPHLGRSVVALNNIEQIGLKLVPEVELDGPQPEPRAQLGERVELAGITHTYRRENDDGSFRLGPIDLSLHRGELLFLVGGNGSGKTTLAKILAGLYVPEAGEIRVDGRRVQDGEWDDYRQNFATVFFDFHLFERLIELADPGLKEQAEQYLARLHLDQKVRIRDGALSTVELSQGQRKRLALLTAYLEDRPVYIFDEWAADQDPMFKEVFYKEILPDLKIRGKAVLVISHDDRYFHLADRIVQLDSGQIVPSTATTAVKRVGT